MNSCQKLLHPDRGRIKRKPRRGRESFSVFDVTLGLGMLLLLS
jgi:hypothetical protein